MCYYPFLLKQFENNELIQLKECILVLIEIKILHIIVDIQNNQAHLASSIKLKLSDLDYSGCHKNLM